MSKQKSRFYDHDYQFDNYYYIHKHSSNIGRMMDNKPDDVAAVFGAEKQQAAKAVKTQYKNYFKSNITSEHMDLLNMAITTGSDEILDALNQSIQADLQQNLRTEKISKLLDVENSLAWNENVLQTLEKNLRNESNDFKYLDNIIGAIAKSIKIMGGSHSRDLAIELLKKTNGNYKNTRAYGDALADWLKNAVKTIDGTRVSLEKLQFEQILAQLTPLVKHLQGKRDKTLTANGLKTLVENNIFSTGFGEAIAAEINRTASKGLSKAFKDIQLSGTDKFKIQYTDIYGNDTKQDGAMSSGKVDIKFNNYTLSLENTELEQYGELKMTVGISNKFYKNGTVYKGEKGESVKGSFSSGHGLTVKRALDQTLSREKRYLAYNVLAWGAKDPEDANLQNAILSLQDVLLTRNVISLFSTRGGAGDFAQFMLLNGQIVSIWDMVKDCVMNNVGKSQSMLNETDKQSIVLHIENREHFADYLQDNNINLKTRSENTNKEINKGKIIAHLRPEFLRRLT